jgi:integrase/recombinase XerD
LASQGRSRNTTRAYRYAVRRFVRFLAKPQDLECFRDVQRADLEAWRLFLSERKYSPSTVACHLHPLLGLFDWLERSGEIFLNPCHGLEIPSVPHRLMFVPTEADMLRLLDSVSGLSPVDLRDRAILEVAYASGFRRCELLALDLTSIDLEQGVIRVIGKGGRERSGLLTQAAVTALGRYLADGRPRLLLHGERDKSLWPTAKFGRRMSPGLLLVLVKDRARAIGLKLTPHGIRRAFATHLLQRGATPIHLRRLLGHISYRHLRHYLRYAPAELLATHRKSCLGQ